MPPERIQDIVTATSECCMNAIIHADGGTLRIYVSDDEGLVQVWVHDKGAGIAFEHLPNATLEKGWSTAGSMGYGFKMMLQAADRISLLTSPSGTTVVVEAYRSSINPINFL
jgi:anti-sigma regulatory factor (Ser/Thr protein kinase)